MSDASQFIMTPGDDPPSAPTGKVRLFYNNAGTLMQIDDAGNITVVGGGVNTHNELTGRDVADCHPISAITGLSSSLANKEDSLGNPDSDGQILSSTASGTRSWIDPPANPAVCCVQNNVQQSIGSGVDISWPITILKNTTYFSHGVPTDDWVRTLIAGWYLFSFKVICVNNESWVDTEFSAYITLNGAEISGTRVTASASTGSDTDTCTLSLPYFPINAMQNSAYKVHVTAGGNDAYIAAGDAFFNIKQLISPEG